MPQLRNILFRDTDPYAGFDRVRHPVDIQGWNSDHPFFKTILTAIRPSLIIEVGTWKGASAIHMANICRALDIDAEILCVDTWLGSAEHILTDSYFDSLRHYNGFPQIYYTFIANVLSQGLERVITPFPISSASAAIVLAQLGVQAQLIYIDAAHDYDAVYQDASAYWPLLADGGVMLFDDYGYSDVSVAACAFAAAQRQPLYASYGKAFIAKGKVQPSLVLTSL